MNMNNIAIFSLNCGQTPGALPSTATTSSSSSPGSAATATTPIGTTCAPPSSARIVLLLALGLGGIVDEKRIQVERVGEDKVPNIVTTDGKRVESSWFTVARRQLDVFEVSIHLHIDTWVEGLSLVWLKVKNSCPCYENFSAFTCQCAVYN